ncbi:MAG TPA: hypothetical protein VJ792_09845 [Candidatus Nitrosotalea sp.]|nr:hypothetical protein [Candidatus Nitrosotalea sp.]
MPSTWALQSNITDPNLTLTLDYPDIVMQGKEFVLSTVVKAQVDQVSNITVAVTCPDLQIQQSSFHLDRLQKDSTFGNNFNATVGKGVPDGKFVANIEVEYFVKGLFDSAPVRHSISQTAQFQVASKPSLSLNLLTPGDVFAGESFSIKGTVTNQGSDMRNLQISASSSELELSGKKSLSVTELDAGKSMDFEFVVSTQKDLSNPVEAIIHLNGTYSGEDGKTYPFDSSFNLFVRERGLLEIGDANGIWVGQFFIAPVVGVGTIVSSVIGFLIFIWHYKNKKKRRRIKKA